LDATNGLYSETRYNAWGQITAKFARGTAAGAASVQQEFSEYDRAGRLLKGNAGGVSKLYGYDANGNATMTVESGGTDGAAWRQETLSG
ncbi:hypothetical protein, partial [Chromobacterium alticapitis]